MNESLGSDIFFLGSSSFPLNNYGMKILVINGKRVRVN